MALNREGNQAQFPTPTDLNDQPATESAPRTALSDTIDNSSLAEVVAPAQDIPAPSPATPAKKSRPPLSAIAVQKPELPEESKPSAKIYFGPPDSGKYFRTLLVPGLCEQTGVDEAGQPIISFTAYHAIKYEGVTFLLAVTDEDLAYIK
jgi:hypothetical protein